MNKELIEAINLLEKENKNNYGRADNVKVNINRETGDFSIVAEREVVETVEDPMTQVSLAEAKLLNSKYELGDIVQFSVNSKEFGRIAVQNAKNVILQKLREAERNALYEEWHCREKDIVTGIVQRYVGRNISINLGKIDTILNESEQVKGEVFKPTERIKLYVIEVKETQRDPRITVSRSHPDLVKRLFESEVAEVRDGTVEIKAIAREAGSRTKMAVSSNDPNVDPVGACVGTRGARVQAIVDELHGEKIDIIAWSEDPQELIASVLSPAKVEKVLPAEDGEKAATVVVPDYQLSLAIGKEGQNVRLAAKVSGWKIDIKSHSQFLAAQESAADIVELDEDDVDAMEDYRAESETTESAEMAEPAAPAETADAEALTETCAAEPQAEEITFVEE